MTDRETRATRTADRLIALAAPLVPADIRDEWRQEWRAELAALADLPPARRRPIRRALGAYADAFWLRQRRTADLDWIDDLRHGWRQLAGHTGFGMAAVGILAIGIAATVTMFSVTDQVLLRPLPYPEPERIVTLWETRASEPGRQDVAPANFLDWRERATAFDTLAAAVPFSVDYTGGSHPEVFFSSQVTPGFFEAFGVQPALGRLFTPEEYEAGRHQVVLFHEPFWRQRFGGDAAILGQTIPLDGRPYTVVGIVPADFEPRLLATSVQRNVWMPKVIQGYEQRIRSSGYWNVVGRLKPGVTLGEAQAELTAISRQLASEYPTTNVQTGALVLPLRDHLVGDLRPAFLLLAGAVLLVLLIACVNVANLLLARGAARERELAIRVALGAATGRVVRQLLLESLLLAGLGGLAGLVLAHGALTGIARLGPATVPWIDTLHLDARALLFAAAVMLAVAAIAGTLPALRSARAGLASAGRQTATAEARQHRLRGALVVVEIAVALVLVAGAGLLLRSFTSLLAVDPGFSRERVLALQVFAHGQYETPEQLAGFFEQTIERLEALPGVQSAGAVLAMPFIETNINVEEPLTLSSRPALLPDDAPRAFVSMASPGYFDTMGIPLLDGRRFDSRDAAGRPPVALISDLLARRYWDDGRSPIGDRIGVNLFGRPHEAEIVGVVGALRHDTLDRPARPEVFFPLAQVPYGSMTFVARTAGDPALLMEAAKAAVWAVNPRQSIYRAATLDELVRQTVTPRRFALSVLIGFALVALLLAAGGVYGVMTAVTEARVREIGVRMALGASRLDVVRWVLGRGFTLAGLGIAIGLAGALGAGRLLQGFLFDVAPADPRAMLSGAAVLLIASAAACYLPARRAAQADPMAVLRAE